MRKFTKEQIEERRIERAYAPYKEWYFKYAEKREMRSNILPFKEFRREYKKLKEGGVAHSIAKYVAIEQQEANENKIDALYNGFIKTPLKEQDKALFDFYFGKGAFDKYVVDGVPKKSFLRRYPEEAYDFTREWWGSEEDESDFFEGISPPEAKANGKKRAMAYAN